VRASVIVNNHNYGRFLGEAIDSALAQSYEDTEVVVVDDGSTDESREIIAGYGDRIDAILKNNGGQGSAFNAGFAASSGGVVVFLDADDVLLPDAARIAVDLLRGGAVKVAWPVREIDASGERTGRVFPDDLPEGDLRGTVLRDGPASHVNPPTSGNAWSRRFLERVLPMPERVFSIWADTYLLELAPLYGPLARAEDPQTLYRVHGENRYAAASFEERLRRGLALYDLICEEMVQHALGVGLELGIDDCRRKSWFHRLERAVAEIVEVVPEGESFVLVDQDEWGTDEVVGGRRRVLFPERGGSYWGAPADDEEALAELARNRERGVRFLVVGWPAFWWLEHYEGLRLQLDSLDACVFANERIVVYRLEP
jgi:glycosyltransferase involved in cell wall biosynthesis